MAQLFLHQCDNCGKQEASQPKLPAFRHRKNNHRAYTTSPDSWFGIGNANYLHACSYQCAKVIMAQYEETHNYCFRLTEDCPLCLENELKEMAGAINE